MPLIKNGAEVVNSWTYLGDEGELNEAGAVTLPLARYVQHSTTISERNARTGVRLQPDDDPDELLPYLQQIQLIEVEFPRYTDGRGYSQAQILRRRHQYTGELRAVGHVLRDQIFYMNRSGFDAYETARADLTNVLEALSEYSEVYQPSATDQVPVFRKRHGR